MGCNQSKKQKEERSRERTRQETPEKSATGSTTTTEDAVHTFSPPMDMARNTSRTGAEMPEVALSYTDQRMKDDQFFHELMERTSHTLISIGRDSNREVIHVGGDYEDVQAGAVDVIGKWESMGEIEGWEVDQEGSESHLSQKAPDVVSVAVLYEPDLIRSHCTEEVVVKMPDF